MILNSIIHKDLLGLTLAAKVVLTNLSFIANRRVMVSMRTLVDLKTCLVVLGKALVAVTIQYQRANHQTKSFRGEDQHASLEVDIRYRLSWCNAEYHLQIPSLNAHGEPEVQRKTLQVKIPAGMKSGQQIRLSWPRASRL